MLSQRIRNGLRSAARKGPTCHVTDHRQGYSKRRARNIFERQHGMRRYPREKSSCALAAKGASRHCGTRTHGVNSKARSQKRMTHELSEAPTVHSQALTIGKREAQKSEHSALRLRQDSRRFLRRIVRELRQCHHPTDQRAAPRGEPTQGHILRGAEYKKRRRHAHGMHGRANIVHESRKREFRRTRSSANRGLPFENGHRLAGLRQSDRG